MFKFFLTAMAGITFLVSTNISAMYDPCNCNGRFWVNAEYLYWKIQDSPKLVPLVVQGPEVPDGAPVLDQPGTEVILGGKKIENNWRSGGRFTLGYWLDDECGLGVETTYFFVPEGSQKHFTFSDGSFASAFFTVPFFDVTTGSESSVTIASPGVFGNLSRFKISNLMQGIELNVLKTIPYSCNLTFGLLGGLRYWNFEERLTFDTSSPFVPPGPTDIFITHDDFRVNNNFYGAQIGAQIDYWLNQFFFKIKGKVALGAMCQKSSIHGNLLTNDFNNYGTALSYPGGYFGMPSNAGSHKRTQFAIIPEGNINVGYEVNDCFRVQLGYTFLYASNVLWAAKQVDRHINPTQSAAIVYDPAPILVGESSPSGKIKAEGLWVQGLNVSLELQF